MLRRWYSVSVAVRRWCNGSATVRCAAGAAVATARARAPARAMARLLRPPYWVAAAALCAQWRWWSGGPVRVEVAELRQFVGNAVVAWPAEAWLGVLQRRRGGADWRQPSDGTPAVPWWRGWRCQAEMEAADPLPPRTDPAVPGPDMLRWRSSAVAMRSERSSSARQRWEAVGDMAETVRATPMVAWRPARVAGADSVRGT